MPAFAIPLILGLIQLGGQYAGEFFAGNDEATKWINLGKQAAAGVASAIAVVTKLNSGTTVTMAELDAALAESKSIHDQVQQA